MIATSKVPYNIISSLDKDFSRRVMRTTIMLSIFLAICSLSFWSLKITLGLTIGMIISIGVMQLLWWMISAVFPAIINNDSINNKNEKVRNTFIVINILKYILISIALFFIFRYLPINIVALFIGVSIVQIVMISKIFGVALVNYLNRQIKPQTNSPIVRH